MKDGSFFSPTHTMTAGGKITNLGGENHILPDPPDESGEVTGAEAREVNNKTGHLRANGGNFAVHFDELFTRLAFGNVRADDARIRIKLPPDAYMER